MSVLTHQDFSAIVQELKNSQTFQAADDCTHSGDMVSSVRQIVTDDILTVFQSAKDENRLPFVTRDIMRALFDPAERERQRQFQLAVLCEYNRRVEDQLKREQSARQAELDRYEAKLDRFTDVMNRRAQEYADMVNRLSQEFANVINRRAQQYKDKRSGWGRLFFTKNFEEWHQSVYGYRSEDFISWQSKAGYDPQVMVGNFEEWHKSVYGYSSDEFETWHLKMYKFVLNLESLKQSE